MKDSGTECGQTWERGWEDVALKPLRPLHRSLQESTRSITHEEITASSLSYLLARHDGPVLKSDRTTVRVYDPGFISQL